MQVFFMEEANKINLWKRFLKPVEIKEDKIFLNDKWKSLSFKQKVKIVKKIGKNLGPSHGDKIILSKNLKSDQDLENLLYSNGWDIVKGKILFQYLILEVVEHICKQNKIIEQETQISVTVNEVNTLTINWIENLCRKFKIVNVVTNHTNYFRRLKERLWEEEGIVITITNNKKKALAKATIILNIDFPEEFINQYVIYEHSILINLEEDVKIRKKRFSGKIVNDYKIKLKKESCIAQSLEKEEYKSFALEDLAEIYLMHHPQEIQNIIIAN